MKTTLPGNILEERTRFGPHVARRVLRVIWYYILVLCYTPAVYAVLEHKINLYN